MVHDLPWKVHPDLTQERLIEVGHLITKGRSDAVIWQNETIGDDNWILGCRAFQASRHQIIAAAESGDLPWLSIVDGSKHLIFKIGDVPVRFYRGPAEEPSSRTLRQTFPELEQLSMVFPDERRDLAYRFAVETDIDGTVSVIKFAGMLGDAPIFSWTVPLEKPMASVFSMVEPLAEGVELAAPVVQISGMEEGEAKSG